MIKRYYLIFILIYLLSFLTSIILLSVFNFSYLLFKIHLWIISLSSLLNFIILLILEYKIKNLKVNNVFIYIIMTFIVFSVLFIYISSFLDNYDNYKIAYLIINLIGYILIIIFSIIVAKIVDKNKKK